ncbi:MAG: diaminopimelate epimerase [Chloroflexota bacterium]
MLRFTKLQGAGNDYIYVDGTQGERDWPSLAVRVSDRHFGIGADGLIVAAPSAVAGIRMRMYNADGSEGEMCGNGIRCLTKFAVERGLAELHGGSLAVETGAGVKTITPVLEGGRIVGAVVDMGAPVLRAADIPVNPARLGTSDLAALDQSVLTASGVGPADLVFDAAAAVDGATFFVTGVSMGNPHVTAFLQEPVSGVDLARLGPLMEHHAAFPRRINFHIVNVASRTHLVTRTWERGSGQTLACGTGACAMVVAARLHGWVDNRVSVMVPGGELTITWPGHGPVLMEGDAVEVFSGELPD